MGFGTQNSGLALILGVSQNHSENRQAPATRPANLSVLNLNSRLPGLIAYHSSNVTMFSEASIQAPSGRPDNPVARRSLGTL